MSVAEVAQRYAVNANFIFKWRRDPRYAPDPAAALGLSEGTRFLPVGIVETMKPPSAAPVAENLIEIELAGGHRMRISGGYDPEVLVRLIRGGGRLDPGSGEHAGLAGGRSDGRAQRICGAGSAGRAILKQDPFAGHLFVFRGRRGDLVKVIWWDGQGACTFLKRLEEGRFVWPSAKDVKVAPSPAQLSMMLEGIDWWASKRTWRPLAAG